MRVWDEEETGRAVLDDDAEEEEEVGRWERSAAALRESIVEGPRLLGRLWMLLLPLLLVGRTVDDLEDERDVGRDVELELTER